MQKYDRVSTGHVRNLLISRRDPVRVAAAAGCVDDDVFVRNEEQNRPMTD